MEQAHILFHLAGPTYIPAAFENPRLFLHTNTAGTINMMEYCRQHNTRMIYTSAYVYGIPQYLPINEEHPVNGINPYAESKLIAEQICKSYHQMYGIETFIVRPFNLYGPGQNKIFLIPKIISQVKQEKIELENPSPKRDYIFINDMINAYLKITEYQSSTLEIFNIGSGQSYTIGEIVSKIKDIAGTEPSVLFTGKNRRNEILETRADISKIKKLLGWKPETSLEEGLRKTILSFFQNDEH